MSGPVLLSYCSTLYRHFCDEDNKDDSAGGNTRIQSVLQGQQKRSLMCLRLVTAKLLRADECNANTSEKWANANNAGNR